MVIESGSWAARLVYGAGSAMLSAELSYAEGTARGGPGENIASDIAVSGNAKAWYRANLMMTNLYAVDGTGGVLAHMQYDAWGKPLLEAHMDLNLSGLEQVASFASYSWDKTLGLWYAQARMYDATMRRFTSGDPVRDGANWYAYCADNPLRFSDPSGCAAKDNNYDWNKVWWVTGFSPYYTGIDVSKLQAIYTVTFTDIGMYRKFIESPDFT